MGGTCNERQIRARKVTSDLFVIPFYRIINEHPVSAEAVVQLMFDVEHVCPSVMTASVLDSDFVDLTDGVIGWHILPS